MTVCRDVKKYALAWHLSWPADPAKERGNPELHLDDNENPPKFKKGAPPIGEMAEHIKSSVEQLRQSRHDAEYLSQVGRKAETPNEPEAEQTTQKKEKELESDSIPF